MAYSISTVALTDTFDTWRQRTNDGLTAINDSTDAATANKLVIRDANGHVSFKNITSANNITISPDTNSGTATVLTVSGSLEASSTTSGSVTLAGGMGVAKNVYIGNSVFVTNTATVSGNTVVGSAAASDKVTFNSRVASDFDPHASQSYDLGDSSLLWANTHTRRLFVTSDASTATTAAVFDLNEDTNIGIDVDAEMTTANAVQIDASAMTTGTALVVRHVADTLTTGKLAYFHDSSNNTGIRDDVTIYQDNASATATTALNVQSVGGGLNANGAVFINHDLTGASNTFVIDTETQTGHGMYVKSDVLTTGITAFLGHSGSNATTTTGNILKVVDNSSDTTARNVAYVLSDAQNLALADQQFDCVSIGFGLRNVTRIQSALGSMFRMLRPGGRIVVLEFSHPSSKLLSRLYDRYSFSVIPRIGRVVTGDERSYRYLVESIRQHPDQEALRKMMAEAGFEDVYYHNLSGGVVALHVGFRY